VYVLHGSSVDLGVKDSESPTVFHLPATAGLSIGTGEFGAGGPDRRITSGTVPFAIVPDGRPVKRVGTAGFGGLATGGVLTGVDGVLAGVLAGASLVGAVRVEAPGVVCVVVAVVAAAVLVRIALRIANAASTHFNARTLVLVTG
jgi:hypothetical protein